MVLFYWICALRHGFGEKNDMGWVGFVRGFFWSSPLSLMFLGVPCMLSIQVGFAYLFVLLIHVGYLLASLTLGSRFHGFMEPFGARKSVLYFLRSLVEEPEVNHFSIYCSRLVPCCNFNQVHHIYPSIEIELLRAFWLHAKRVSFPFSLDKGVESLRKGLLNNLIFFPSTSPST